MLLMYNNGRKICKKGFCPYTKNVEFIQDLYQE